MPDDYLWDKTGEPDPEVRRLEELLAPLAWRPEEARLRRPRYWHVFALVAAALVVVAAAVWSASRRPAGPSWQVVAIDGITPASKMSRGGTVETDSVSRLRLDLDTFGQVDVEPNTSLKLLVTRQDEQRMALARGKIHATIWAPPRQFYVNTPSAVTVDLGCSYTLEVNGAGDGVVRVDFGWVAFEDHGQESFIPAHAVCITRRGKGPGIPYYEDAPQGMRSAVERFDISGDPRAIPAILSEARKQDGLTLWHLLRRVPATDRASVYDRFAHLVEVPQNISRDRVLAGDPKAIDGLWNALGLGDANFWREWKR